MTNIAGLKGGYYAWFRVFDNKLNRRNLGEYQEEMLGAGDSGGIHASGAGFERSDSADRFIPLHMIRCQLAGCWSYS